MRFFRFAAVILFVTTPTLSADKPVKFTAEQLAFFKNKVQPLLKARCFKCHTSTLKEPKGGLMLDSRAGVLKGGESGAAAVPGDPKKSRLIEAINYESFEMPPRSKLPAGEIAILTKWVKIGLPYSKGTGTAKTIKLPKFPLQERKKKHWAWQPIRMSAIPKVKNAKWAVTAIDRFILAKLEAKGLTPATIADRRTLIRRATFDLIGLPPSRKEIAEFVNDPAPTRKAFAKVVDRLLKSPHFGERWARHWLDLMRYGDTLGHEFDYPLRHAHEYRDYVIRALNADVPYDQFVKEHIAGDLMKKPRRHPTLGYNESIIGTGFWFLGEDKHAPVDVKGEEAGKIDNQIDVFSKAFLGLTVACARCHDHKFDAISTKDYYALSGFLQSSRRHTALLDPKGAIWWRVAELSELSRRGTFLLKLLDGETIGYFEAAALSLQGKRDESAAFAKTHKLDAGLLKKLVDAVRSKEADRMTHPLWAFKQWATGKAKSVADVRKQLAEAKKKYEQAVAKSKLFADFNGKDFGKWLPTGYAFGDEPTQPGEWNARGVATPGIADSGRLGEKPAGVLRSPTFKLTHDQVLYRVKGRGRIRLIIDGYVMDEFSGLLFKGCLVKVNTRGRWQWIRQGGDVHRYKGHRAHIEFIDDGDGSLAVDEVRFANRNAPTPPELPHRLADVWTKNKSSLDKQATFALAKQIGLFTDPETSKQLAVLRTKMQKIDAGMPSPMRVIAMTDGSGENEHVFIRGSHKNLGVEVPRRLLTAIAGDNQPVIKTGSGRLSLAERMFDPKNPFPARVMVNRIWHHLLGRGIVSSVDNFGVLGQRPTHPKLLDYLAATFRRDAESPFAPRKDALSRSERRLSARPWSVKRMIRRVMLTSTYMMSSGPAPRGGRALDPNNTLLYQARVRRLQGEAIRDAMLSVAGRLDRKMFGPPVPIHLTRFMQGRGRPRRSGPVDGNGRRSLYIIIRRNFISPMMLAFDTPIPFTAIGRRNVSNVPAQALILLNDPFVTQQAERWAKRMLADKSLNPTQRISAMYETAFARKPRPEETKNGLAFLQAQAASLGRKGDAWKTDQNTWRDFAHVLFNVKEFIYLR